MSKKRIYFSSQNIAILLGILIIFSNCASNSTVKDGEKKEIPNIKLVKKSRIYDFKPFNKSQGTMALILTPALARCQQNYFDSGVYLKVLNSVESLWLLSPKAVCAHLLSKEGAVQKVLYAMAKEAERKKKGYVDNTDLIKFINNPPADEKNRRFMRNFILFRFSLEDIPQYTLIKKSYLKFFGICTQNFLEGLNLYFAGNFEDDEDTAYKIHKNATKIGLLSRQIGYEFGHNYDNSYKGYWFFKDVTEEVKNSILNGDIKISFILHQLNHDLDPTAKLDVASPNHDIKSITPILWIEYYSEK